MLIKKKDDSTILKCIHLMYITPMALFDLIRKLYQKYPLYSALALGFVFRSVAALYNNTPIAEDDYANIISPALKSLQTDHVESFFRLELK